MSTPPTIAPHLQPHLSNVTTTQIPQRKPATRVHFLQEKPADQVPKRRQITTERLRNPPESQMHSQPHLKHARHDSHHNFSAEAKDFQPRSPSPLKQHHQASPSPSRPLGNPSPYHHHFDIPPFKASPITPPPYHQPRRQLPSLANRTTIHRWERTSRKFTLPCRKCTDDGLTEEEAADHSMIECRAVPEYHRVKLRKDREELHGEFLEVLQANFEPPVFDAMEAMGRVLPEVAKEEWIRGGRVVAGAREEAVEILRREEGGESVSESEESG